MIEDGVAKMWQKFRIITIPDFPELSGKEIWVEMTSPEKYTGNTKDGEEISVLGYRTNLRYENNNTPCIIGKNNGELLPEFQENVSIEKLKATVFN